MIEFLVVLAVVAVVVVVVAAPVWRSSSAAANGASSERSELEAAREAKLREIREAELDHRTGKLSDADYELLDAQLRAEAVEILRALDSPPGDSGEA